MSELENYISSYFGVVTKKEKDLIVSFFENKTIEKGEIILEIGKDCQWMSFIQDGVFRVYAFENGKEVTQWIGTKGYFLTDISGFILNTPSKWNIQALTDGELLSISRKNYMKLYTLVPLWKELEMRFLVRCFSMMEDRIFSHLSLSAEERYHNFFTLHRDLFSQVPLQYMASMLGMTPETFSRVRKKLLR
jgi:CRP-like cAMP-binding protein